MKIIDALKEAFREPTVEEQKAAVLRDNLLHYLLSDDPAGYSKSIRKHFSKLNNYCSANELLVKDFLTIDELMDLAVFHNTSGTNELTEKELQTRYDFECNC